MAGRKQVLKSEKTKKKGEPSPAVRFFKNPKTYFTAGAALLLTAAVSAAALSIGGCSNKFGPVSAKDRKTEEPGVIFYGFGKDIDYTDYLPLALSEDLLKNYGGLAFQEDKGIIYANGEYRDVSGVIGEGGTLCSYADKVMTVDADLLGRAAGMDCGSGKITVEELAEKLAKEAFVYENKLCVLLDSGSGADVFDDYYTFEMISLKLRNAPQEDFDNALINLPDTLTNGDNYTVKYTDSDLELGLSTELYGAQGYGNAIDDGKLMPIIVAGEGSGKNNHTLIRVYNRYSAKTAQFLAYSAEITGGVKVAAGKVGDRTVVAAAAYNGSYPETKSVRVFDKYGVLYMTATPEFRDSAPYLILIGDFDGSGEDKLLVTPEKADENGDLPYELFSLKEGKVAAKGTFSLGQSSAGDPAEIAEGSGKLLITDKKLNKAFTAVPEGGTFKVTPVDVNVDGSASFVAFSAFQEDAFAVSIVKSSEDPDRSYLRFYAGTGDSYGTKTDIGVYENIFFWYTDRSNYNLEAVKNLELGDTDYVKKAAFQHLRTDQASKLIKELTNSKKLKTLAEAAFSSWKTGSIIRNYSASFNVWEPCFTHRLNISASTTILARSFDENGFQRFLAYTSSDETANYEELGTQFYNATYAEGIIEMDKLRIYPLRGTLQNLYGYFRNDPEKLAGLEPIHEIEINVGETFGDYNPKNVEGFRSYLLERFGSVENINARFGTSFNSRQDIDAPRNGAKGERDDWDKFEGDYFIQWALFTRKIVNKRLTEAFREALLAGFPSEIISGHSIPEGDAITGFLGQADTRMSPVDAMMTLGCHFGATRYSYWCTDTNNFLNLAYKAGFKNVTLGEYNSLAAYKTGNPLRQMEYIWSHGAKYINILNVSDNGTAGDIKAVSTLIAKNQPRSGYAGGTGKSIPVNTGVKAYQLVELGPDETGLLKSVDHEGNWTGDVYLVPFHSRVAVESIPVTKEIRGGTVSTVIGDLQTGDVIELNWLGSYKGKGTAKLSVEVYEDEVKNLNLSGEFVIGPEKKPIKYVLSNQVPLGAVKVKITYICDDYNALEIEDISLSVERESVARKYFDDYTAEAHTGGFTFDTAGAPEKIY